MKTSTSKVIGSLMPFDFQHTALISGENLGRGILGPMKSNLKGANINKVVVIEFRILLTQPCNCKVWKHLL